jgi:type III pantothenate kinase
MILEVDVGNTRVKWRLIEGGAVIARGFEEAAKLTSVDEVNKCLLINVVPSHLLAAVHIATVVLSFRKLFTLWAAQYSLTPVFAKTLPSFNGVTNAYDDVSQMGVDRWLVIVAAYQKIKGACFVIDVGSAVTIDIVKEGGEHLGGYIVPGLQLMRRSLFGEIDQVGSNAEKTPEVNMYSSSAIFPGRNTQVAVSEGLPLMLLGMVHWLLLDFQAATGVDPSILVTGGDGGFLVDLLREKNIVGIEYVPELVLDGLSLVINN